MALGAHCAVCDDDDEDDGLEKKQRMQTSNNCCVLFLEFLMVSEGFVEKQKPTRNVNTILRTLTSHNQSMFFT